MLPEDPNTCTMISFPGNSSSRMRCIFLTNLPRMSVSSCFGSNRSYSSRMSPLSLSSSCGSSVFLSSSFAWSSISSDW
jgi:hypothetical protein